MPKMRTVGVIGGGVAGLAAGALLSQKGWKVKLFEANAKLGGSCANTQVEGYTFNDGALYLVFPRLLDHVFEKLGLDRSSQLPLRKIRANQRATLPDGTVVCLGDGLDVTVENSRRAVDNVRLREELRRMMDKWEPVLDVYAEDILLHPFSVPRFLARAWRHLPLLRGTLASELNRLFGDEVVRAAMSGVLLFTGVPPEKMPVFSILHRNVSTYSSGDVCGGLE